MDTPMTLIERLRNPQWRAPFVPTPMVPGQSFTLTVGTPEPILDTVVTREAMDEAADLIGALWALIGDAARHRPLASKATTEA